MTIKLLPLSQLRLILTSACPQYIHWSTQKRGGFLFDVFCGQLRYQTESTGDIQPQNTVNMTILLWVNGKLVDGKDLDWIIPDGKLIRLSQLENLWGKVQGRWSTMS